MTCEGCRAREAELAYLRKQNSDLLDRVVAMANPMALAVARGDMPALPQVQTPQGSADGLDAQGRPYVLVDGRPVPLEEWQRAQEMLQRQMAGG